MGFALKLAKTPQEQINSKVEEAARILDLEQHLDRKPANLSGGQRQRVAMGRAIVRAPASLDGRAAVKPRRQAARADAHRDLPDPAAPGGSPNNLFVAGFIGSPSMNFLAGELDGDNVKLPIGSVPIPDALRRRLQSGPGGGRKGVIAGLRPEHFEDAGLVAAALAGSRSRPRSTCSSRWARSSMRTSWSNPTASRRPNEELAQDAGSVDLPSMGDGTQVTARLGADSTARQGAEAELWFDSHHLQLFDAESGESLLGSNHPGNGAAQAPPASSGASTPS